MRKWIVVAVLLLLSLGISQMVVVEPNKSDRLTLRPLALYIDGTVVRSKNTAVPPAIQYQGTVYVPITLVSQQLNKPAGYDPSTSTVWLGQRPTKPEAVPTLASAAAASGVQTSPKATGSKTAVPAPAKQEEAKSRFSLFGLSLGMTEQQIIAKLGKPARKDPAQLGYEWWIYNQNPNRYLQVGIANGKVVDLYSNAPGAEVEGVRIGSTYDSVSRKYPIVPVVTFTFQSANVKITNQPKERPLVLEENTPIIFYLDKHNNATVNAIRLIDQLMLLRGGFYETKWTYQGTAPDFDPPRLSIKQQEAVNEAHERQILDLTNVIRFRNKLPALTWHANAAKVARGHSKDMEMNRFFDHVSSSTGLDPFQRLKKAGVSYQMAGENIAAGFPDAIEAYESWMNSPGHRKNILEKDFLQLGVGVYYDYFTQNFITAGRTAAK